MRLLLLKDIPGTRSAQYWNHTLIEVGQEDVRVTSDSPPSPAGTEPVRAPGMRRGSTQSAERWAVWNVDGIVSHALGWHFREQPLLDYGADSQWPQEL